MISGHERLEIYSKVSTNPSTYVSFGALPPRTSFLLGGLSGAIITEVGVLVAAREEVRAGGAMIGTAGELVVVAGGAGTGGRGDSNEALLRTEAAGTTLSRDEDAGEDAMAVVVGVGGCGGTGLGDSSDDTLVRERLSPSTFREGGGTGSNRLTVPTGVAETEFDGSSEARNAI
jgi:hypothetical protein